MLQTHQQISECSNKQQYVALQRQCYRPTNRYLNVVTNSNTSHSNTNATAENILNIFEIENDTIRYTDVSDLKAIFPLCEEAASAVSPGKRECRIGFVFHEIVKWFYWDGTRRYVEQINQSPHHF